MTFFYELRDRGFIRVSEIRQPEPDRCECACPDVWVRPTSAGNEYRCGWCGKYVLGMERAVQPVPLRRSNDHVV